MKRILFAFTIFSLLFISSPSNAFTGIKVAKCSLLNEANQSHRRLDATAIHMWVYGFLTSYAATTEKDILKGKSSEEIDEWINNACRKNPEKNLYETSMDYIMELSLQDIDWSKYQKHD